MAVGDLVLTQGPHTLSDHLDTPAGAIIYGPGRSAGPEQAASAAGDHWRMAATRSYGEGPDAPTVIAHASYRADSVVSQRLLATVPDVLPVRAPLIPFPLRELFATEVARAGPHQQHVLDRLLDVVVAMALRSWLEDPRADAHPWLTALHDRHVGPALVAMHQHPAHPWTTQTLAERAHTSRAHLVRRFNAVLGQPPITYLTRYRIDLAAELVTTTSRPLAAIASEVGYSDAFALSTAYRRITGHPPQGDR